MQQYAGSPQHINLRNLPPFTLGPPSLAVQEQTKEEPETQSLEKNWIKRRRENQGHDLQAHVNT